MLWALVYLALFVSPCRKYIFNRLGPHTLQGGSWIPISGTEIGARLRSKPSQLTVRWILFEDGKEKRTKEGEKPDLLTTTKPVFDLTIVVPAYNEEKRLPTMMQETIPVCPLKLRFFLVP